MTQRREFRAPDEVARQARLLTANIEAMRVQREALEAAERAAREEDEEAIALLLEHL